MFWLQENNRRIFFSDALVIKDDRIRCELWTAAPFIRIPLTGSMIEDQQRAAVLDKLQQPGIELN
jgi:hypothetical protein